MTKKVLAVSPKCWVIKKNIVTLEIQRDSVSTFIVMSSTTSHDSYYHNIILASKLTHEEAEKFIEEF